MQGKGQKKIGNFTITRQLLGEGSFSSVYLAYDQHQNKVAAKVIPITGISSDVIINLEREINILRKCRHENIVSLIDAKKSHNNLYIFIEYCEDGTLEDFLREKKRISEEEAMKLFLQIVRGMQALIVNKIVHRDIKPPNILIKQGVIKISDFGLAKKFINQEMHQTFAGSPLHMAPQIIRGDPYSEKVDVYSAGVVLYQMMFGNVPFNFRGDYHELLKAKDKGMKESKNVRVSENIKNLIEKMVEANPERRIGMNGVLDFMEEYLEQKKEVRVNIYKKLSMKNMLNIGVMGSMLGGMNFNYSLLPTLPTNFDLRMYGKLCQSLTVANN